MQNDTNLTAKPIITTTDPAYYANHSDDALRAIVKRYTETSLYIASNEYAEHPLAIEALAISNAAWCELHTRSAA